MLHCQHMRSTASSAPPVPSQRPMLGFLWTQGAKWPLKWGNLPSAELVPHQRPRVWRYCWYQPLTTSGLKGVPIILEYCSHTRTYSSSEICAPPLPPPFGIPPIKGPPPPMPIIPLGAAGALLPIPPMAPIPLMLPMPCRCRKRSFQTNFSRKHQSTRTH
jgi:hypothetical protein